MVKKALGMKKALRKKGPRKNVAALRKNVGDRFADVVEEYVKEQHRLGKGPDEIRKLLKKRYPGFDLEADWVHVWLPGDPGDP